jgi:hypothetical protein
LDPSNSLRARAPAYPNDPLTSGPIRRCLSGAGVIKRICPRSLGGIALCSLILLNPRTWTTVPIAVSGSVRRGLTAEVLEPADLCSYGSSFRRPVPLVGRLTALPNSHTDQIWRAPNGL